MELSERRCHELLAVMSSRIGRVAFAEDGNPDWPSVLPVTFAYRDGAIFFRTFEGSKLFAALRNQRVAFEVDQVDDDWHEGWSVVALGRLTVVEDDDQRGDVDGELEPWVTGMAERMVCLDVERISGREVIGGPPS